MAKRKECKKKKAIVVDKKEEIIPKILIGVPILAWTHEFAISFLKFWTDLVTYQQKGRRFHVGFEFMYRKPVHMAEEELVQMAISTGCTHVLLMDDDIYDVNAESFLKLLDADKDIISGIMYTNSFPFAMCAFRRYDPEKKVADMPVMEGPARLYEVPPEQRIGIQPVDLVPFCFTLIKTSLFNKIPKPWFRCDNQAPTDSWFMDSVMEKGVQPYAHFDVWLNHRGVNRNNVELWKQMRMIEQQAQAGPNIINLTQEEMQRHEVYMAQKLKDAEASVKARAAGQIGFYDKVDNKVAMPITKIGG